MAPIVGPRLSAPVARTQPAGTHVVAARSATGRGAGIASSGSRVHTSANSTSFADSSSLSLQDLLNPIPGLGFDFSDLAVFNHDLGIKAVVDPATQWRLSVAERLLRESPGFGGSGFLLFDGGGAYAVPAETPQPEQAPQQQPQIIVLQAAPAAQQAAAPPDREPETAAPLPDVGQFILVLQSGKQIQAVAFTRTGDRIIYVTADGGRHTIATIDLDSDETNRINEERGTPLQLSL
ncbi:MAG TPA: hypothetical protein VN822_07860 [Candidatus Acidoferrales bacterium]|nr:hypothetical protein [Candidatus Acidoferrales bacterium]